MAYTRTPTLASPVSLDELMQHMRTGGHGMTPEADMALESQMLADAAAAEIEAYAEIALLRQTITVWAEADGLEMLHLPVGPLAPGAVVEVNGIPLAGLVEGGRWPRLTFAPPVTGPLAVTYQAGFGDDHHSVPADLRLAIMDHAAWLHDLRAAANAPQGLSPAAARIAARYRRVRA